MTKTLWSFGCSECNRVKHWPADLVVPGLRPAGGRNVFNHIANSLSISPTHRPDITEILLKKQGSSYRDTREKKSSCRIKLLPVLSEGEVIIINI